MLHLKKKNPPKCKERNILCVCSCRTVWHSTDFIICDMWVFHMTVVSSTEDTMYQNRSETLSCTKRRQAARLTPANAPKARVTPGSDTREERSVRGVQELLPVIRSRNTAGPANNVRDPLSGAFLPPCCRKLELVTCCARLSVRWYCVSLRCTFSPVCCTAVQQRLAQQGGWQRWGDT